MTAPGIGAYSVTKFGIVALTETLAQELELAGSKIRASVLCPGPVWTNIKHSSRNRPAWLGAAGLQDVDIEQEDPWRDARWIAPTDVGAILVDTIKHPELYAVTHPE